MDLRSSEWLVGLCEKTNVRTVNAGDITASLSKFSALSQTVTTESLMASEGSEEFLRKRQASLPSTRPADAPVAKEVSGPGSTYRNAQVRENTAKLTEGAQPETCQPAREMREPGAEDKSSSSAESKGVRNQRSRRECEAGRHKPQHQVSKSGKTIAESSSAYEQPDEGVPRRQPGCEGRCRFS